LSINYDTPAKAVRCTYRTFGAEAVRGEEDYVSRIIGQPVDFRFYKGLCGIVKHIGVTKGFKDVIDYFHVPEKEIPAGFRPEPVLEPDGLFRIDLARDISYDKNGVKRPTKLLFSADSANPYEVEPIAGLLANLTCNPGIVYDLFINNPEANIGGRYKNRDEVMRELGRILGPGCDISVELNNPFEEDFGKILEEVKKFEEILGKWRLVVKVPHTGPVNSENVGELLEGDKKFSRSYTGVSTRDALRGHNLSLKLTQLGYRINFTLMFEPYQTMLALQARPYFINSFIRHRLVQSTLIKQYIDCYNVTGNLRFLEELRKFMLDQDYLPKSEQAADLLTVLSNAKNLLKYRRFEDDKEIDGLDGVRHNLRMLRLCNMPDTRLIICSMEGEQNYPQLDRLLSEPEFEDMAGRVVITAEPNYLARFTSTNQVISYQRRFMNAARNQS
jgi:hypothetical protein